jgi:hypothetical protein
MYYPYIDRYEFYENLPIYLLIFVILVLISIFVYIKLSFPFWNIQPVYHTYDFWRALYSRPFLIHNNDYILRCASIRYAHKNTNKYHDLKQVKIIPFVDATDTQKQAFVNLLQCFLLPSENAVFVFNLENLESYLGGHMFSSYLSLYERSGIERSGIERSGIERSGIQSEKPLDPIACISSRSGELSIRGYKTPIYYIDFLCVKREENFKKISRTLLQTHIYKQQLIDEMESRTHVGSQMILVSLFRREKELLTGIVPLTRFQTVYYEIPKINNKMVLSDHVVLIHIDHTNMDIFIDFLEGSQSRFECFLRTDIANLIGMIKSGILYVYCLKRMDDILSVYIFRDTRMSYDGLGGILQLVGTIHNSSSLPLFINGFINSVFEVIKKIPVYKVLMVDEIGDNQLIMRAIGGRIIQRHLTAYYLYNMVVPYSPLRSMGCFILF